MIWCDIILCCVYIYIYICVCVCMYMHRHVSTMCLCMHICSMAKSRPSPPMFAVILGGFGRLQTGLFGVLAARTGSGLEVLVFGAWDSAWCRVEAQGSSVFRCSHQGCPLLRGFGSQPRQGLSCVVFALQRVAGIEAYPQSRHPSALDWL